MIDTGSQHGIIEKGEGKIMHSVFQFGDKKAKDIMTHRKEVVWLNVNHDKNQLLNEIFQSAFSKYPVCDGTIDRVIGLLQLTEALKYVSSGDFSIREHLLEPLFFSETTPVLHILEEFRNKKIHMGFVVNEKNITVGIITLQDLIENIVGEFPELEDLETPTIIRRSNGSFLIDADISMEEVRTTLTLGEQSDNDSYQTLAGFMIGQLQSTPKTGSHFVFGKYKFEIIDMDGNRIDKVMVTILKK
jgi:putative hemolysin